VLDVRLETRPGYIFASVTGDFDLAQARESILRIAGACRAAGVDAVLVDARAIASQVGVMHRYELAKVIADDTQMRMRMAVVVNRENMFSKTLEETARNLGVELCTTDSMAEGLIFLGLMPDR
jgi:hypothetical protein